MSSPAPAAVRFQVRRPCADGECAASLRSDGRCDCSDPVHLVDVDELLDVEVEAFAESGTASQRRELATHFGALPTQKYVDRLAPVSISRNWAGGSVDGRA